MINKKNLIFFLIFILLNNCSFDNKTGIWGDSEKEKRKISELEKKQKQILDVEKIYSSDKIYLKEVPLTKNISLSKPKKNLSWKMSSLNHQNFLGNIYLSGIDNIFLKKKIGKDKFSESRVITSLLVIKNNIILSDDTGTIFNINQNGKINWKKNIYKKIYKKIYKNLVFSIYKNNIYIADNIGFIYVISLDTGKLLWIKNYYIPLRSNIKIFDNKIYLIDQDNRILCLNIKDGTKIWDILSISSFIKSQNLLSLAVSKKGDLVAITSSSDLYKVEGNSGNFSWVSNTFGSLLADATDFFKSSQVVITDDEVIISAGPSIFSYNLNIGSITWENELSSIGTPIIDGKNIFCVTENGYFVIMNRDTGKIISSTNILKILKKKKQKTKITGFIMGSGKVYSVTLNGYLIVSSAISGKVENFKKIGNPIISAPIISNGKLYILTKNSRIIGFN
jgi:outer membrane protein assembly factor BamB